MYLFLQEFWCILHGFLYFLAIPSMSMLLMLYSIGNLHVVSWGTRETPKPAAGTCMGFFSQTLHYNNTVLNNIELTKILQSFFKIEQKIYSLKLHCMVNAFSNRFVYINETYEKKEMSRV